MSELDDLNELLGDSKDFSTIPPKVLQAGEQLITTCMTAGFEGLATFIGKGVLSQLTKCYYTSAGEALEDLSEKHIVTEITWSGDREGKIYLLIPESGAKGAIAYFLALAMGTEPDFEGTKLDEEAMDAYSELANTVAQQGAQALRGEEAAGGKVNFKVEKNFIFSSEDDAVSIFGGEDMIFARAQITVEGLPPFEIVFFMTLSCTGMEDQAVIKTTEGLVENEDVGDIFNTTEVKKPRDKNKNLGLAVRLPVPVIVVLATTKMRVENIKELAPGSIIEFKKFAGEFLDVCAENTKFAEGEVVIVNQHFGIQIRRMTPTIPPSRLLK